MMKNLLSRVCSRFKREAPPVQVFARHCHYSAASAHKKRFSTFSKEDCLRNLLQTLEGQQVNVTFFLDTYYPMQEKHFLYQQHAFPIIEIKAGTEAESFLMMLDYVCQQPLHPDTILYFVEDDYVHRPGWLGVLKEGIGLPGVDYVTVFDHRDKYFLSEYEGLQSKIFHTPSCHWRTTPSTTNTYAMRFQTLQEDIQIHRQYSRDCRISLDHAKFLALGEQGRVLISSIPGYATHDDPACASPCIHWEKVVMSTNGGCEISEKG